MAHAGLAATRHLTASSRIAAWLLCAAVALFPFQLLRAFEERFASAQLSDAVVALAAIAWAVGGGARRAARDGRFTWALAAWWTAGLVAVLTAPHPASAGPWKLVGHAGLIAV